MGGSQTPGPGPASCPAAAPLSARQATVIKHLVETAGPPQLINLAEVASFNTTNGTVSVTAAWIPEFSWFPGGLWGFVSLGGAFFWEADTW